MPCVLLACARITARPPISWRLEGVIRRSQGAAGRPKCSCPSISPKCPPRALLTPPVTPPKNKKRVQSLMARFARGALVALAVLLALGAAEAGQCRCNKFPSADIAEW